jgi:two-component sensor histidine kinase
MRPKIEICNDPARLAALYAYEILDTPREAEFDRLVDLASRICGTPIALISLIENHRQWFKAEIGLGLRETPLDMSVCRHLLIEGGLVVIKDTLGDERLQDNPLVSADGGVRFYAGCPLRAAGGQVIGMLCVLDRRPRDLDDDQRFALETLAEQVAMQMELRLAVRQKNQLLDRQKTLLQEVNHRVKNNLQLISSLVNLQIRSVQDPAGKAALLDMSGRIQSIAAVHEQLYRTDDMNSVDLHAFLACLVRDIQGSAPAGVTLALDAVPMKASLDKAVSLALIVNELLTNALRYAYPEEGGPIRISMEPEAKGRIRISIRDRGKGLPADFDARRPRSVGMRIIQALAGQIDAEFTIADASPGTLASIVFHPMAGKGD